MAFKEANYPASSGQPKPEPMPINLRELVDQYGGLQSPEGEDYVHPVAVRVNRGGEITEVTSTGTRLSAGEAHGRGVRIEIDFDSEQGINWTLAFTFGKGCTHTSVLKRGTNDVYCWPPVIWRD